MSVESGNLFDAYNKYYSVNLSIEIVSIGFFYIPFED